MLHRSKCIVLLLLVCMWPALAWSQQEMRSSTKGASTPLPITGSAIDADHNALDVKCLAGCTGGGGAGDASLAEQQAQTALLTTIDADTGTIAETVQTEDAAHSSGHKGVMMLGVRNDSGATTLTDTNGDYSPIAVDNLGRLFITQTSIAPGTAAGHLGKAEDAAHTTGDAGVMALCVRRDTAATSATTDGDYNPCQTDATGRTWTNTELPDAATLAENTATPSVPAVGAYGMVYDGTNWDFAQKADAGAGSVGSATQRVVLAYDSGVCNAKNTSQVAVSVSSSGNNELVALTSAQTIYVCDLTLIADGAVDVQLIYGTGTACGTGETNMSGVMKLTAAGSGWTHDYGGRLKTAEANALCLELSGAVAVNGILTYRKAATF